MSYHRKRAAIACTFCRNRKRRCDGGKPACSHCTDLQVECQYDELPSQRIDTSGGSREIINRLRGIETMLRYQSDTLSTITQAGSLTLSSINETSPQSQHSAAAPNALPMDVDVTENLPPLTIPVKHRTSSNYLLTLPMMKSLIGENPPDLFYRLEARNPVPRALRYDHLPLQDLSTEPVVSVPEDADPLVSSFFATAHPTHPILDQDEFADIYARFKQSAVDAPIEQALCLVVMAVGAAAQSSPDPTIFSESPPGMQYMQKALPTLILQSSWSFSSSLLLSQALVIASVYFAYIVRPLQSWKLIQAASSNLQLKLSSSGVHEQDAGTKETIIRLFWSCFLIECDRLAELELPRSGLQQLVDSTSLPDCTNLDLRQSTCYLAEISVRRLLNRVHNSLYPRKNHSLAMFSTSLAAPEDLTVNELSSIMAICDELYSQLRTWHASIPEAHRPSLDTAHVAEQERETILRIRYYAARHIIWRPFVIYVASCGLQHVSGEVYDRASMCLESCRNYIHSTTTVLRRPSMYTWTFSLSTLGAVIVLTMASLSPDLAHLVPDIDELQSLAISNVRPWAFSSLESVVSILEDMQRKCQRLARVQTA